MHHEEEKIKVGRQGGGGWLILSRTECADGMMEIDQGDRQIENTMRFPSI
jgi:hypothetical protein